jgi:2-dehydropantoate 2-reductase
MRFVVVGAGAIGGVLGARLAQAGFDVVLVARGTHGEAIRANGLRVESPDGAATLRLPVEPRPDAVAFREGDVVLLATKSNDTEAALEALARAAPPETPLVCVQNGVANERTALRFFANVYAVCVMCPAEHLEPGVVVAQSAPLTGLLDIGRYPAGSDAIADDVGRAWRAATWDVEVRADIMRWKYRKLLLNLGNAVEATCARGSGRRVLIERLRDEGERALAAAGIPVASAAEDEARRRDLLRVRPVAGRPRGGSSTWQSLARGTGSVESDYLNGEIVLLGRLHGVPTPANALVQLVAREHAAARREPRTLSAAGLLERLAAPS